MKLTQTGDMLRDAQARGYALGAFNVETMEMAQAVVAAAEKMRAPVIVQTTAYVLDYAPAEVFSAMLSAICKDAGVPVALHLDHGDTLARVRAALGAGYTSVMIDGSLLSFAENVALTREAVALACRVPVEAELGTVGGVEDGHSAESALYTDPVQAAEFERLTGVTALAVAIGTAHGVYKGEPKLDVERLSDIRARVSVPLVLHGASGVPFAQVRECVRRGICKVNFATELRQAFTKGVRETLAANPAAYTPREYLAGGRRQVEELVCERIALLGGEGKAL